MGYRIAVVGATGTVGRAMLSILFERGFPVDDIIALASAQSIGTQVPFGDQSLRTRALTGFDFKGWDLALFAVGAEATKTTAPKAAAAGCVVIDNSSLYRCDADVPLIVPEVNAHAIAGVRARNIVANPNCSTAQMVVALKPLHDRAMIKRVVVSTYQSVSGAGKRGIDALQNQSEAHRTPSESPSPKVFPKPMAFNVIPHIDRFMEDGSTREEWKMGAETQKILDPSIQVVATCVRVPVFVGHAEAVNIEFASALGEDEARAILRTAPGVEVIDTREDGGYATPVDSEQKDAVFVSRIRRDPTLENGLNLWCVSDNLRKGAALNAAQIAELLHARALLGGAAPTAANAAA
ncbi:MAG: aspartate-semialdehyde dehydrogenase [Rhodobacteraceae bacterium]|nr:aspartate-semialdehyde dehydrogenase [Paracoccaceae bacterium]